MYNFKNTTNGWCKSQRVMKNNICLLCIQLMSVLVTMFPAICSGAWLDDLKTGCAVWSNFGIANKVRWDPHVTASCVNGRVNGPGDVFFMQNGNVIQVVLGRWVDGYIHGDPWVINIPQLGDASFLTCHFDMSRQLSPCTFHGLCIYDRARNDLDRCEFDILSLPSPY